MYQLQFSSRARKSQTVGNICTDARHANPLFRVTPKEFIEQGEDYYYDKDKHREMLLEAAETLLGYFGFNRTAYGDSLPKKNKKWWHELHEGRTRDTDRENIVFGAGN